MPWCGACPTRRLRLQDEARKVLAWEDIEDQDTDRLDDSQKRQLAENLKKAQRDLQGVRLADVQTRHGARQGQRDPGQGPSAWSIPAPPAT